MKKYLGILTLLLFLSQSAAWALNPSRTYKQRPEKYNMEYKAFQVPTNDKKAKLNAWYFPATVKKDKKKRTSKLILISHNGEGNMGDYLRRVDQFTSIGYNVVTYDYRGYGESSDFEIDNNQYIYAEFTNDVSSMIAYCSEKYADSDLNIYGWGVGAGLSLGVGFHKKEVKTIIADTPFLSMEDLETRFESCEKPLTIPNNYPSQYEPIVALSKEPTTAKNINFICEDEGLKETGGQYCGDTDHFRTVTTLTNKLKALSQDIRAEVTVMKNSDKKANDGDIEIKTISKFLEKSK